MFKLPFIKTQNKTKFPEENFLAMDIGTEYLKTVLFKPTELGIEVLKISRVQQQQNAMNKGIITNLNTVLENCRLSINEITSSIDKNDFPKKVVMGIAGEFVQGVSIVVNYERDEKFDKEVDFKEQDKIVNKVYNQITESGKDDLARRTGLTNEDIEILHITVTGMEIGGMNVDSLVGFKGKTVKLYFYASFAPKTFVDSLSSLAKSLELELFGLVSQPFAVARAYSTGKNKDFSGIFIDIGGGTTDIAIVNKGNVLDTQMFAFGGRVYTKEIAREQNLDYRHAEARKLKYSEGELDKKIASEVKSICYSTTQIWIKSLKAAFEMCEDVDSFPPQIFLCGGGSLLPEIRSALLEYPWDKFLPFASIPKVTLFLPNRLDEVFDRSGNINNTFDVTPLALAKFAYDKIKHPRNYYNG